METKRYKFPVSIPFLIAFALFSLISSIAALVNVQILSSAVFAIWVAAYVLLVIDLFMKKRGILMVLATALPIFATFLNFLGNLFYFIRDLVNGYLYATGIIHSIVTLFTDLFRMVGWMAMLLAVLALIPKLFNLDLSKLSGLVHKFWFAPCAFLLLCTVAEGFLSLVIHAFVGFFGFGSILDYFLSIFTCAVNLLPWFFLCLWLRDPYDTRPVKEEEEIPAEAVDMSELPIDSAKQDMVIHILLTLFTCGFWQLLWIYKTTAALNGIKGEADRSPLTEFLLSLIPFYWIYWTVKSAQRIDTIAHTRGLKSNVVVLDLLMSLLLGGVGPILMQDQINNIIDGTTGQRMDLSSAKRDLVFHIVMLVATGGIWQLYWIYKTTAALNGIEGQEDRSPIKEFLLSLIPYYWIYWVVRSAMRVDAIAAKKGLQSNVMVLDLLMSLLLGIVGPILLQNQINNIAAE